MNALLRHTLLLILVTFATAAPAATFTVDVAGDGPAGACTTGTCTLRNAIVAANTAAGADTIAFALVAGAGGVATITPTSPLPEITGDDTTIDGYTQAGASQGSPSPAAFTGTIKVLVEGAGVTGSPAPSGLRLAANRATVRGLAIRGFTGAQIDITGSNNIVRGNLIGLAPDLAVAVPLTALGVRITGGGASAPRGNVIGGFSGLGHRNVIAGNLTGVLIENAGFGSNLDEENRVSGNFINVAPNGTSPMPGEHGVQVRGSRNIRIGSSPSSPPADANDIGGATGPESFGIVLSGGSRLFVDSNWIGGTSRGVSHPLGTGIFITNGATEAFIQSNLIFAVRNNGIEVHDGTAAPGATSALLERNTVLSVGGMSIDLNGDGITANDANDADVGPNRLVNSPTLTGVRLVSGNYLLDFTLNAEPNTLYGIEAFVMNKNRSGTAGSPVAKDANPRSQNATAAIFGQSGGSFTTNASGSATGSVTVPSALVEDGYALGANTTRALISGCCFVSGEVVSIDSPLFSDASILVFDHAFDFATYNASTVAYSTVSVLRQGSTVGTVSVLIRREFGASTTPFIPLAGQTLTWADGDASPRTFMVGFELAGPGRGQLGAAVLEISNASGAVIGSPRFYTLGVVNAADAPFVLNKILFGGLGGSFEDRAPPP